MLSNAAKSPGKSELSHFSRLEDLANRGVPNIGQKHSRFLFPKLPRDILIQILIQHGFAGAEEFREPGLDMASESLGQGDGHIGLPGYSHRKVAIIGA